MKSLSIHSNQLSGSIPPELGRLSNLESLALENNELNGNIPTQLINLNNLSSLRLQENQLSGNIPSGLFNMNNLTFLNLSDNYLSGNLPSDFGNVNILYLTENELSGCYLGTLTLFCDQFRDSNISQGNNFNTTWEDFCKDGTDTCLSTSCEPSWIITESMPFYDLYQSSEFILTNGNLTIQSNQQATYNSKEVILNEGFSVEIGASFEVHNNACK